MSTQPPPGPVRFRDLVENDKLLWIYCRACYREVEILARAFPAHIPLDMPVPRIAQLLTCSSCGSREIWASGQFYRGGFIGGRAKARGGGLVPAEWYTVIYGASLQPLTVTAI